MCGIAGFIGFSQRHKVSYELITSLFECSESRGIDASGVWGTDIMDQVIYHKEPIRSSQFIKSGFWQQVRRFKADLMLVHARAASKGPDHARINANNHPFVSSDRQIGMVHNGCIEEFDFLKDKYEVSSDTDSEILLRMYEHGDSRMDGIKDIWSVVSEGAMAVALAERSNKDFKVLVLFRNEKRPLWVADLRDTLGQIFFFSSLDVWYRALAHASRALKEAVENQKLIEIPAREVWSFSYCVSDRTLSWKKYDLKIEDTGKTWKHEGEKLKIKSNKPDCEVITNLKECDVIDCPQVEPECLPSLRHGFDGRIQKTDVQVNTEIDRQNALFNSYGRDTDDPTEMYIGHHDMICNRIVELARDIDTAVSNACMENTMSPTEYQELLESLEQTKLDLEGTLEIIGN